MIRRLITKFTKMLCHENLELNGNFLLSLSSQHTSLTISTPQLMFTGRTICRYSTSCDYLTCWDHSLTLTIGYNSARKIITLLLFVVIDTRLHEALSQTDIILTMLLNGRLNDVGTTKPRDDKFFSSN